MLSDQIDFEGREADLRAQVDPIHISEGKLVRVLDISEQKHEQIRPHPLHHQEKLKVLNH